LEFFGIVLEFFGIGKVDCIRIYSENALHFSDSKEFQNNTKEFQMNYEAM
jgi:hypothetical protein